MLTYNVKCAECGDKIEFVTDDNSAFEVRLRRLKPSSLYSRIFTAEQSSSMIYCPDCYKKLVYCIGNFEREAQNENS